MLILYSYSYAFIVDPLSGFVVTESSPMNDASMKREDFVYTNGVAGIYVVLHVYMTNYRQITHDILYASCLRKICEVS